MSYRTLFLFFGFLFFLGENARAALLQGRVMEKGTKAPIPGASLLLKSNPTHIPGNLSEIMPSVPVPPAEGTGTSLVSSTPSFSVDVDVQGRYRLDLPPGDYVLTVVGEGYERLTIAPFHVEKDMERDFYLERSGFTLPEVLVSASRDNKTEVSHEVVSKEELAAVPGNGGDVLRALQSLPGVAVAGDFSGQLIVRGGGPEDNLYLLDRIPLAFPFHFGGLISTVNSDLIKSVDFSAGNFGPQYGNYWGGVIDITDRNPRPDRWGFRAEVNMLLSEGLVEGPLTGNSSLALAGRRSYLEIFGGALGDFTLVPSFGDYQVKYAWEEDKNTHWDFQAFGSDDKLGFEIKPDSDIAKQDPAFAGLFQFHNGFDSQGLNYRRLLGDQDILWETFYHYRFFFDTQLGNQGLHMNIADDDTGNTFDWVHDFDKDTSLRVGMNFDNFTISNDSYFPDIPGEGQPSFDLTTSTKYSSDVNTNASTWGFYLDQHFKWLDKKLILSAGGRMDFNTYNDHVDWSPRFSAAYLLSPETTLKGAFGYYYQLPIQGPYLDPNFGNTELDSERSVSSVLGVEQKLSNGLFGRVEAYNKDLTQVVVSDPLLRYSNAGTGYARGVEFFLRRPPTERFFGWISYAFSSTWRDNGPGLSHIYDYDQPHILTLVAQYKLNPGWDLGLKWRYNSGLPDTPVIGATYDPGYNRYLPVYGGVNSDRLPDYNRIDLSTSFTTSYDTWEWRFFIEILNVTNHENVDAYTYNSDYTQRKDLKEIPFLPYLGFEAKY